MINKSCKAKTFTLPIIIKSTKPIELSYMNFKCHANKWLCDTKAVIVLLPYVTCMVVDGGEGILLRP